jgi:hypothetical protein
VILTARTIARAGAASRDPMASACDPIATSTCARRPIDLVICLDTSGSMEALIDSARARLWDIVTSLSSARPIPELRVGLLTYGSPSRSTPSHGWIVRQTDLSSDLDSVYAKMMSFSTDGGDEFVGWVLHDALTQMNWSRDPRALKLVFVAGNESADQAKDVFDFRREAALARQKGIIVNAIYAGNRDAGVQERWAEVASCGGGNYTAIDMQCGTVQIETPQDKILIELNLKLNATYVPYGAEGHVGASRQAEQDVVARSAGPASAASRVAAKGTALYQNTGWDLVDAVERGEKKLEEMKESELPPPMRGMPAPQRAQYLAQKRTERAAIQKQIAEVGSERERILKDARAKASGGKIALDDAMVGAIREQAKQQGFKFE